MPSPQSYSEVPAQNAYPRAASGVGPDTVSLVVAMRNEREFIAECLSSLLAQDYPADNLEIFVVDGMSTDGSRAEAERVSALHPGRIRILENPRCITPVAFNIGIQSSTGKFIAIVSGHSTLARDYVSRAVEALHRTKADHVGGLATAVGLTKVATAIAESTNSPFAVGDSKFHYDTREQFVDSVYMGLYRREVFDRIGLFDEELVRNQDDEFNYRLCRAGGTHFQTPTLRSRYYSRATYRRLWKQYFQYGVYKPLVLTKVPGCWRWRHLVPTGFVLALITTMAGTLVVHDLKYLFYAIVGSYASVVAVGALSVASRRGWSLVILSAITFPTIHLAYGSGFLIGLCTQRLNGHTQ